jgi:hypothetical protein
MLKLVAKFWIIGREMQKCKKNFQKITKLKLLVQMLDLYPTLKNQIKMHPAAAGPATPGCISRGGTDGFSGLRRLSDFRLAYDWVAGFAPAA